MGQGPSPGVPVYTSPQAWSLRKQLPPSLSFASSLIEHIAFYWLGPRLERPL